MKKSLISAFLLIEAFFFQSIARAASNWELVKEKDNIKVYTRPSPGSEIDEFRGTTIMNVGVEVILALLFDVENQSKWMDRCIEGRLVKLVNEYEGIIYNITDLPWPCDDRDVVVQQFFKIDKMARIIINFQAIENDTKYVPLRKNTVRMTELKGQWLLVSLDRHRTQVTYTISANPAGMIPEWMANYASRNIPYETLTSMLDLVRQPKYAKLGEKFKKQYGSIAEELVRGRLRANAKEIRETGGNDTLIELLQEDDELIRAILNSTGDARTLIKRWVDTKYHQVEGKWQKRAEGE